MSLERKRLFYDIETSFAEGYFWRPGYNQQIHASQILRHAQIICISWSWEHEEEVHHAHWGLNKQCDKKLLKKFIKELNRADELISHNGKKFDIRWIRTRAIFHDIKDMRPVYNEIDTLTWAKKYLNMPSNSLANIANYYGLEAKLDSGGMDTWLGVVIRKDQESLDRMLEYCDGDIRTLKAVFHKLNKYCEPTYHYGVKSGGDRWQCPECGNVQINYRNQYVTKQGTVSHYLRCNDLDCNKSFKVNNKVYLDWLSERRDLDPRYSA